jgi:hypothetical protein
MAARGARRGHAAPGVAAKLWVGRHPELQWREAANIPPAAQFSSSPDDSEAHDARKHTTQWVGDKGHRTATCDDDLPHLITHVEPPIGPASDGAATPKIHAALQQRGLLPGTPIVDTGFLDAKLFVDSRDDSGSIGLGPHASTITGRHAREPALTPSTSRSIGTGPTRPVRPARAARAGRRPWIIAGMPLSR